MRKPIEDKSPLAAWATLSREGAGMSVEEVVDALAARNHAVKASTIRGIEGGSKGASVRLRRLLAEVYGVTPPGQKETAPPEGEAVLAQAIRDGISEQTQVFRELLEELRSYRLEQVEFLRTMRGELARVEPMPERDPEHEPRDPVPNGSRQRSVETAGT